MPGRSGADSGGGSVFAGGIKFDPNLADAAYNLAILLADRQPEQTLALCRKAVSLRPQEVRYAYTLAFFLNRSGHVTEAVSVLRSVVERNPGHADAVALLGAIYEKTGKRNEALRLYQSAVTNRDLPEEARQRFAALQATLRHR